MVFTNTQWLTLGAFLLVVAILSILFIWWQHDSVRAAWHEASITIAESLELYSQRVFPEEDRNPVIVAHRRTLREAIAIAEWTSQHYRVQPQGTSKLPHPAPPRPDHVAGTIIGPDGRRHQW